MCPPQGTNPCAHGVEPVNWSTATRGMWVCSKKITILNQLTPILYKSAVGGSVRAGGSFF